MVNNDFLMGYGAGKAAGGGGGSTLITKTITENGTYAASSDNADGYSSVTVDVAGGDTPVVPAGYTQLDYITGDGNAYIDTGVTRQAGDELELVGGISPSHGSGYWHPFGTPNCFIQFQNYLPPVQTATAHLNSSGNHTTQIISLLTEYRITDTTFYQTDVRGYTTGVVSYSGDVAADTQSMILFGRHTASGGVDYKANGYSIFRFKWYRGGALIHDFVPAIQQSDNALGMYDIIDNVFHTNAASTGAFSGGTLD